MMRRSSTTGATHPGKYSHRSATVLAALLLLGLGVGIPADTARSQGATASVCTLAPDTLDRASTVPPAFYAIDLVPTGNVIGTGEYVGAAEVRLDESPFDVAVTGDGALRRHVRVDMRGLRPPPAGEYVVWATPPNLETVEKLGVLGEDMMLTGQVAFPKFLLVISLEEDPAEVRRWSGPIVHRGMSRSGFMHTMAGHGPFQGEPCGSYGFGS